MTLVGFLARRPVLFAARTSGESSTCACGTALRVVAVVVVGLSCGSAAYSVSANAVRPQLRIAFITASYEWVNVTLARRNFLFRPESCILAGEFRQSSCHRSSAISPLESAPFYRERPSLSLPASL